MGQIGFPDKFRPGIDKVQFAGIYHSAEERAKVIEAYDRGWFGSGPFCHELEKRLAAYHGLRRAILVNSGSSANLLALAALREKYALWPGDEIIVPAMSFPTTVNPILQLGLIPVFVDIELGTYNIDTALLPQALSPRTAGVMLAHTLGIPCDINGLLDFVTNAGIRFLVEDCCDSMGSLYQGQMVGGFGDVATLSFYASHHMSTAGLGGAVLSDDPELMRIVRSLKEWGKMCVCEPCPITIDPNRSCVFNYGEDIDGIEGYDRRYSYARLGYNLQMTELQAAFGLAQMDRLDWFAERRRYNFGRLYGFFEDYQDWLILPRCYDGSEPNWFAFPLTVRDDAPFTRHQIVTYLEEHKVETRLLFGGNLTRHPAYENVQIRIATPLTNSDKAMIGSFFLGVWPGIDETQLGYMLGILDDFLRSK